MKGDKAEGREKSEVEGRSAVRRERKEGGNVGW